MVLGARAGGVPKEAPIAFGNGAIVDAGFAAAHQAAVVKLPVFVAVGAIPLPSIVVPLVLEADGDAVVAKGPHFFDQAIVQLFGPLALQKGANGLATLENFGPIAPKTVCGVGQGDAIGVAAIPSVFGHADFGDRNFLRKGRH